MTVLQPIYENWSRVLNRLRKEKDSTKFMHLYNTFMCEGEAKHHTRFANELMSLLVDLGVMCQAQHIFDRLAFRNENSWNILIIGYARCKESLHALTLYQKMREEGHCSANGYTLVALVKVCSDIKDLQKGRKIHADIAKLGLLENDMYIASTLIDMYVKCGSFSEAKGVFNEFQSHNVVTWTILVAGYIEYGFDEEALKSIDQMQQEAISPNAFTYVCNLKACGNLGATSKTQEVHNEVVLKGLEKELHVVNCLITAYTKCGLIGTGKKLFLELQIKDVVSWTALITGLVDHGCAVEAISHVMEMRCKSIPLNSNTFVSGLKACGVAGNKDSAFVIHSEVEKKGLGREILVGNSLIDTYIKCGLLESAEKVFNNLAVKDVISWTAMVSGYGEKGKVDEVLNCFDQMYQENVSPNVFTFVAGLQACSSVRVMDKVSHLHVEIVKKGLEAESLLGNTLVDAYAKCGMIEIARDIFRKLSEWDVISWNALISGYLEHGSAEEALLCAEAMKEQQKLPTVLTFVCCLKACGSLAAVDKGQELHDEIVLRGLEEEQLVNSALIHMYIKCSALSEAEDVFQHICVQDVYAWNAILAGYTEHGFFDKALKGFGEMEQKCIPSDITTLVNSLRLSVNMREIISGFQTHVAIMKRGLEEEYVIGNALVDLYSKCGMMETAEKIFINLPVQDVMSWNAIVEGYVEYQYDENASDYLKLLQQETVFFDAIGCSSALKVCSSIRAMEKGREIHNQVVQKGFENEILVGGTLVDMYCKCGLLREAQVIFDDLPVHDLVLWNSLIAGYVEYGYDKEALICYDNMQVECVQPDTITLSCILKACISIRDLRGVYLIHDMVVQKGLEKELLMGSVLVEVYAKYSLLEEAQYVFLKLSSRDVVSWNALISGYTESGDVEQVCCCIERMQQERIAPDSRTFICSLKSYSSSIFMEGLHAEVIKKGFGTDLLIGSTLVDTYAQMGFLEAAQHVFDRLPVKDVILWAALVTGYAEHERGDQVLNLLKEMNTHGICPNKGILVSIVKVCGDARNINEGCAIHADIVKRGLEIETFIGNTLVDLYAKCGLLSTAQCMFDDLPMKDEVSWNIMTAGYVEHGYSERALSLFEQMRRLGVSPNAVTLVCCLKACGSTRAILVGKEIHKDIVEQAVEIDLLIGNTLVDMYSKCGSHVEALAVFNRLPARDQVSWNVLTAGYAEHYKFEEVLNQLCQMENLHVPPSPSTFVYGIKACGGLQAGNRGKKLHLQVLKRGLEMDVQIGICLVDMYANCGLLLEARGVFDRLMTRDAVSWNALITGYVNHGHAGDAYICIKEMANGGISSNSFLSACILKAVGTIGSITMGRDAHSDTVKTGLEVELFLGNMLIDMYAKCGFLSEAHQVFDQLADRGVVTWNSLVLGYGQLGSAEIVFHLLNRMESEMVDPDAVTLISVLNACSHAGSTREAYMCFATMCKTYDIFPSIEHYNCMVDLLGRAGCVEEAVGMIAKVPFHPRGVVWHTLLGACRKWSNRELGKCAFEHAVELDNHDGPAHVCMHNIYVEASFQEASCSVDIAVEGGDNNIYVFAA